MAIWNGNEIFIRKAVEICRWKGRNKKNPWEGVDCGRTTVDFYDGKWYVVLRSKDDILDVAEIVGQNVYYCGRWPIYLENEKLIRPTMRAIDSGFFDCTLDGRKVSRQEYLNYLIEKSKKPVFW